MNRSINFTIVIPHYNIPNLLSRCLQSIPQREDIQIIVVDDCSPSSENLFTLVPELSWPNVEYYSTPFGGSAGRARNIGIEHACGKWITFIDADDLFVPEVEAILDRNKDRAEDVIYFQSRSVLNSNLTQQSNRNIFKYHFEEYFRSGNEQLLRFEFDAPWGKFVKKSLIDRHSIRFDEIRYSNDTYFSAAIGVYASNIYVSEDIIYIVTERDGSLTADKLKTVEEWEIRLISCLKVQAFLDNHNISYRRYAFTDFLFLMWTRNKKICISYFWKLSFRNKCRFLYCLLRKYL